MTAPHEHNRRAWDQRARKQERFARPAPDEQFHDPLDSVDGCGWLGGDIRGLDVLCLAAGGGRQGPLYAAAGAKVTVVDISRAMLEIDREVAAERGLQLRTVETSMDDLRAFEAARFDLVIHPVSTCYVADLHTVYSEVARVTRSGGLYISQHKQPASLQTADEPGPSGFVVQHAYYRDGPLPSGPPQSRVREEGILEYLHRWESLLGHMCRAGFVIEDVSEPMHADPQAAPGTFANRSIYLPPYIRIKARRRPSEDGGGSPRIWTPPS